MAKKKRPRFLWITDPWDTLDHKRDTTLRLAQEAVLAGYACSWCDFRSLRHENGRVLGDLREIREIPGDRSPLSIVRSEVSGSDPAEFDSIHYRPDPPVDAGYLHPLQLLSLAAGGRKSARIVNPPEILSLHGEKLEPLGLRDLSPPSIVSSSWEHLGRFGKAQGRTVLKPLNDAQSKGIHRIDWSLPGEEDRARTLLSQATENFKRPVLLQRFQEEIQNGEFRLWFLDGKLLAYVKKFPLSGDFRVNLDQGSKVASAELGKAEKKAVAPLSKRLRQLEIRLAAIDLIGGYVTDFNFTSPGLLPVMEEVLGKNLARPVIRALVSKN